MPSQDAAAEPSPVIWARLDRSARRPHPSLTHEQIVRAAMEIADAQGVQALSMRKVASKLGSGTMSLYRYVASKDDLLDLMVDAVIGEDPLPDEPSGDWRADLAEQARRARRAAHRHPWAIGFILARPNLGPNALRSIEYSMAAVDGLGLDIDGMLDMVATVNAFAIGFVQSELAEDQARRRTGLTDEQWRARMAPYVRTLLATGWYPFLERIVVEAEDFPDVDATFERRLAFVLDGLAANLEHPTPRPS
ncbi:MAG TPA: TetR/AcrR family transcriptional regulator [Actinomycetes bacterium]|jgi:AcrR family transcriptional regulator|nr:TetR/AcrR family transcriptional regulator [Actinomycetes bacterium]